MYKYPLNLEVSEAGLDDGAKLKDSKKQTVLRGSDIADDVRAGTKPYLVLSGEKQGQSVYLIQYQELNEKAQWAIGAADGTQLGVLIEEDKGKWNILSFGGLPIGKAREKNRWRRADVFILAPDWLEALLYLLFPRRYELELNGRSLLKLHEKDPTGLGENGFKIKKTGECSEVEENLLVGCIFALFWPE